MENARSDESQAGIKIAVRNINNLRYAANTTLMAESEEELKSLLMKGKEGKSKSWLETQHSEKQDHGIWSHHFTANRWGNNGNSEILISLGSKITTDGDCSHETKRCLFLGRKAMTNPDSILKSRAIMLPAKVYIVKAMVSSSNHAWMWELNHNEGWALKNWGFQTVMLEKTPESPLDYKEIKPVNPKRNQFWIFIGRADAEAEAPIFWPQNIGCKELTHWKRPWCWERLRAGEEGDRG